MLADAGTKNGDGDNCNEVLENKLKQFKIEFEEAMDKESPIYSFGLHNISNCLPSWNICNAYYVEYHMTSMKNNYFVEIHKNGQIWYAHSSDVRARVRCFDENDECLKSRIDYDRQNDKYYLNFVESHNGNNGRDVSLMQTINDYHKIVLDFDRFDYLFAMSSSRCVKKDPNDVHDRSGPIEFKLSLVNSVY